MDQEGSTTNTEDAHPTHVVHNHGPSEGPGLACPERVVAGRLVGDCLRNRNPLEYCRWCGHSHLSHRESCPARDIESAAAISPSATKAQRELARRALNTLKARVGEDVELWAWKLVEDVVRADD